MCKQEVFFEEDSAKRFIEKLRDMGAHFEVSYEDYWQLDERIPCIVVYYSED